MIKFKKVPVPVPVPSPERISRTQTTTTSRVKLTPGEKFLKLLMLASFLYWFFRCTKLLSVDSDALIAYRCCFGLSVAPSSWFTISGWLPSAYHMYPAYCPRSQQEGYQHGTFDVSLKLFNTYLRGEDFNNRFITCSFVSVPLASVPSVLPSHSDFDRVNLHFAYCTLRGTLPNPPFLSAVLLAFPVSSSWCPIFDY